MATLGTPVPIPALAILRTASSRTPMALVMSLAILIIGFSVLFGTEVWDLAAHPRADPAAGATRAVAILLASGYDAGRATGPSHLRSTAGDSLPANHRSESVAAHDAIGVAQGRPVRPGADSRRWAWAVTAALEMELARGTRAESTQLATIAMRRDDPRMVLLRTAVWSRERG